MAGAQEKTEKATPQKRRESRRKGQVAKSQEVPTALILLFVFITLFFIGGWMLDKLLVLLKETLLNKLELDLTAETTKQLLTEVSYAGLTVVAPILVVTYVAAFIGNYMQIGFLFSTEAIQMKLEKINPIKGAKRLVSMRMVVDLLKSVIKIGFIGTVVFIIIWKEKSDVMLLSQKSIGEGLALISSLTFQVGMAVSLVLLFLAVFDYMYQKFEHEKQIRMSKQDIKDEHKKTDGDPLIKSKIKQKQREMSMNRMLTETKNADVLITNPTHFAVALKYDQETMAAPMIIAMGKDHIALKMREVAKENDIITMENKPLARALYFQTEIGDYVPEDLFKAVAEILAYVYSLKGRVG
jgi:flagellar biosynthesis protein FlhB